jgi:hypothetical protein
MNASLPAPVRWATYPGNVVHIIGEVKGPNLLGESLTAVTATYDPGTNRTRVGFTFQRVEPEQP